MGHRQPRSRPGDEQRRGVRPPMATLFLPFRERRVALAVQQGVRKDWPHTGINIHKHRGYI